MSNRRKQMCTFAFEQSVIETQNKGEDATAIALSAYRCSCWRSFDAIYLVACNE